MYGGGSACPLPGSGLLDLVDSWPGSLLPPRRTLVTYSTVVRLGWLQKPKLVRSCGKDRIRAGEPLRVKLMIDRGKASFPFTWMHVRDELYDASGKLAHVHHKLLYCGRSRHLVYEYEIPNTGRGEYRFGWTRIRLAEPLGIAGRKWITTGGPAPGVVVYPRPLAGLADMMPWRHSDSGAAIGAAIASASSLVSTVRDYTHGDPPCSASIGRAQPVPAG